MDNSTIVDRIRLQASNDYQQRVPAASQAGIAQVVRELERPHNRRLWNEFATSLITMIGTQIIRSKTWENPLAEFKRIPIDQPGTIQEIGFNLIKAKGFDRDDNNLFEENAPELKVAYHSVDRKDRYDITINETELRTAFRSPNGLNDFVAGLLAVPITSDNNDEYRIMLNLLAEYHDKWGMFNVQVPAILKTGTRDEKVAAAEDFTEAIREKVLELKFLKNTYNAYGVPTFTNPENAVIFTTPAIVARLDVRVLAQAFNVSEAEMTARVKVVDELPVPNTYAILCDEDFFVCRDEVLETRSFENPMSLSTNYYLHHWATMSVSPFMNVISFGTDPSTNVDVVEFEPTGFDFTVDYVDGFNRFTGGLVGDVTPANRKVLDVLSSTIWNVDKITKADDSNVVVRGNSYVDRLGKLYLQKNAWDDGTVITITAESTYNGNGVGESPVTLVKTRDFVLTDGVLTAVEPEPEPTP